MKLISQNAPGFARALIACHQAYRRNSEQLASFDDKLGRATSFAEPTPYEEVRDFFHFVDNYVDQLDVAAERLAADIGIGERETGAALAEHLEARYHVRMAPSGVDEDIIPRFDARSKLLFLNPLFTAGDAQLPDCFPDRQNGSGARGHESSARG